MRRLKSPSRKVILAVQILLALGAPAWAAKPSFECEKATSQVEKLICADAVLANLDVQAAAALKRDLQADTEEEKRDTVLNQDLWLKRRDAECRDYADLRGCIFNEYQAELFNLRNFAGSHVPGQTEIMFGGGLRRAFSGRPEDGPSDFNSDINGQRISGHLTSCSLVMEVPLTRYETGRGGDCVLQDSGGKKRHVLVCNDTGVGRFKLIPAGPHIASKHDLAQFAADNCTGG